MLLLAIQRAAYPASAFIQDMRVNHRGRDILVPEQFLYSADVVAILKQVRCK